MAIFDIDQDTFVRLENELAKLSKKAQKLGLPVPTMQRVGVRKVEIMDDIIGKTGIYYDMITVEVEGNADIRIQGWAFAATLDNDSVAGTMIRRNPSFQGPDIPTMYYQAERVCEHCKTKRSRKDVYVLYHADTQTWKQVGSSCLSDFLRYGYVME